MVGSRFLIRFPSLCSKKLCTKIVLYDLSSVRSHIFKYSFQVMNKFIGKFNLLCLMRIMWGNSNLLLFWDCLDFITYLNNFICNNTLTWKAFVWQQEILFISLHSQMLQHTLPWSTFLNHLNYSGALLRCSAPSNKYKIFYYFILFSFLFFKVKNCFLSCISWCILLASPRNVFDLTCFSMASHQSSLSECHFQLKLPICFSSSYNSPRKFVL